MKNTIKKLVPLLLAAAVLITLGIPAFAAQGNAETANTIAAGLAKWESENNPVPAGTDINGDIDWSAFACFRSGCGGYETYLSYINRAVAANFNALNLNDLARIVLAVGAAGGDAKSVGGHDLVAAIISADFDAEVYTAYISYALLALNSKAYADDSVTGKLVQILLAAQRPDGGFNYLLKIDPENSYSKDGDADSTAMVLQALAPYADDTAVAAVIQTSIAFLNACQKDSGGFGGAWGESADTTSQVITALCALGIDPLGDEYVKGGKTVLDAAQAYLNEDGGVKGWDGKSNVMSTNQMLYALAAYIRLAGDECGLFDFSDAAPAEETTEVQSTEIETGETTEPVTETLSPQTGSAPMAGVAFLLLASIALAAVTKMKKDEK